MIEETLFNAVERLDSTELDRILPAQYYRWPETVLVMNCESCAFAWDCEFEVYETYYGFDLRPENDEDNYCPKCLKETG